MKRIAIFASGNGSNAENLIRFFQGHSEVFVEVVVTNNPNAGVILRAQALGVPVLVIENRWFAEGNTITHWLINNKIDFIVLAGFLRKVPNELIAAFPSAIINIHPSLLPNFGGKGMYGRRVHEAVLSAGVPETGITVHLVNEEYDKGAIIYQHRFTIPPATDLRILETLIHEAEFKYFPDAVLSYICSYVV